MTMKTIKKHFLDICLAAVIILFFTGINNFALASDNGIVDFSWLPNTEADLAGYKIHYGINQNGPYDLIVDVGNPSPVDGRIKGSVTGLSEGVTYYFVATAYNEAGLESDYSDDEAIYTCPLESLLSPTGLQIISID